MPAENLKPQRHSSWSRTLLRATLVCAGAVAILLPAWLPNRPDVQIERGTVELLQAFLLAAAAAVMFGASSHAGPNRPVCRVLALGLLAAFVGEIEDFVSEILGLRFPEAWIIGVILAFVLATILRHRRVMLHFLSTLGNHAGSGLIGAALLIIYVFNRVIGSPKFWQACLGPAFSPEIPKICKSYLELLACYLLFIGTLGLSITLARRQEPK
jgi:predicted membrane protein